MAPIYVVYEAGVFRPLEPLDLPEGTAVTFELRIAEGNRASENGEIYELYNLQIHTSPARAEV